MVLWYTVKHFLRLNSISFIWEAEGEGILSSRPVWATVSIWGQPWAFTENYLKIESFNIMGQRNQFNYGELGKLVPGLSFSLQHISPPLHKHMPIILNWIGAHPEVLILLYLLRTYLYIQPFYEYLWLQHINGRLHTSVCLTPHANVNTSSPLNPFPPCCCSLWSSFQTVRHPISLGFPIRDL